MPLAKLRWRNPFDTHEGFVEMIGIGESCVQSNGLQRGIRINEIPLGPLDAKTANLVGNCPTQRFFKTPFKYTSGSRGGSDNVVRPDHLITRFGYVAQSLSHDLVFGFFAGFGELG